VTSDNRRDAWRAQRYRALKLINDGGRGNGRLRQQVAEVAGKFRAVLKK